MSTGSLTPRKNRSRDSFDDDMEDSRPLVAEEKSDSTDIPMCGCMSIKFYQPVRLSILIDARVHLTLTFGSPDYSILMLTPAMW